MSLKQKKVKSKKSSGAPMPAAGAGLIRFFQDDTHGIKIGPKAVVILSIAFVGIVMILHVLQI